MLANLASQWGMTELGARIFLDRYSLKDNSSIKTGDLVFVSHPSQKGVNDSDVRVLGTVIKTKGAFAAVETEHNEIIETRKDTLEKPIENPDDSWKRLARELGNPKFYDILKDWKFLPGGRIYAGAGNPNVTLANCFVLPDIPDSRKGIFDSLYKAGEILSRGGGIGMNFSQLRPKNAPVKSVGGHSSGVVSWMELFSQVGGCIQQGGSQRRGAEMIMLADWHPDIFDFINSKRKAGKLINANISVLISDEFIKAVKEDGDWVLWFPDTSSSNYNEAWGGNKKSTLEKNIPILEYKRIKARELWDEIINAAWASAEPGLFFIDRVNEYSNSKYYKEGWISASNPCQPSFAQVLRFSDVGGDLATIGDISIGDQIWNGYKWVPVLNKWSNGVKEVYQYTTDYGEFVGTVDHLVFYKGQKIRVDEAVAIDVPGGGVADIKRKEFLGKYEVFDLTVGGGKYWTSGLLVSNCAEQPLSPDSACVLGHINLSKFVKDGVDWDGLKETVGLGVVFLDNVIDQSAWPFPENEAKQKLERRIGLGTVGLAEMLIRLGIRYGSAEAIKFCDELFSKIMEYAYDKSCQLALLRGPFPAYSEKFLESKYLDLLPDHVRAYISYWGMRNVTVLTQAPTGSVGTMANTSTGIEPFFALEWIRRSRMGEHEERVRVYDEWRKEHSDKPDYFVTAMELTPYEHVDMLAVVQKWTDSSVSKTCNVPSHWTRKQVSDLYMYMYDAGCKGGTIYRDGSRSEQVLELKNKKPDNPDCPEESGSCDLIREEGCLKCRACGWSKCER